MDPLTAKLLSELELVDASLFHQWETKSNINQAMRDLPLINPFLAFPSSSTIETSHDQTSIDQTSKWAAEKVVEHNDFNSYSKSQKSDLRKESSFPSFNIISFGETNSNPRTMHVIKSETDVMSNEALEYAEVTVKSGITRKPLQAQDHVLAERKRRQKLSEQFIALAAIVPGLKKLDKASVLGGAIRYLKELEERIKVLEANKKRQHEESVVSSKRPRLSPSYDDTSSSEVNFEGGPDHPSPEIEVRISGDSILIGVYCNKTNGTTNEMLREIEKLQLSVLSSAVIPFGNTALSITIIAQMDGDNGMTAQELSRKIRQAVVKLV